MTWYYVGPDKTGFDCSDCCAAFYESYGSCYLRSCSYSGGQVRRNYVCPSTQFPTPFHYYQRNPTTGNISIAPNPRLCATVDPDCASYTPSTGLNAAGRIGSGCNQDYVTATSNCYAVTQPCPNLGCEAACGYVQTGEVIYPYACNPNPSGYCGCNSAGSSYSTCACECVDGPFGGACYQTVDPGAPCYAGGGGGDCRTCPDGTLVCSGATCPCEENGLPNPPCNSCQEIACDGENYYCAPKTCSSACSAGYVCVCGSCSCNTSSTCCTGYYFGFSWDPTTKECRSCGYDYQSSSSGCCDLNFKRKNCDPGSVCCNDGRCYDADTTLCTY